MRTTIFLLLVLLLNPAPLCGVEPCREIHGRAVLYRGDGFFSIWHIGTHHIFSPADKTSAELVCKYFDCDDPERQPALFADFLICTTAPYIKGASQPVIVKRVRHARVVTEWSPK